MKKVLVVEDNDLNMDLVTQVLEDDFDLSTARDGQEGIEQARTVRPDVILMDLSLPVLDGWEATRRLRADPELSKTPIIALSAHAAHADIERALGAGCDAYVTKPIDEDELKEAIARVLDGRGSAT